MGPPPVKLMIEAICQAAMMFPVGTGLGWDGIHPRAICRLSQATLEWLAEVLHYCETMGEWPKAIDVVIIALLPKSDGAKTYWPHAPIGEAVDQSEKGHLYEVGKRKPASLLICRQRNGSRHCSLEAGSKG